MKALSLTQPWATLLALGEKKVETRSWLTKANPGRIAIHAAKGFPSWCKALMDEEPFKSRLAWWGITSGNETHATMPRGAIIGTATLRICVKTEQVRHQLSERELAFGDYSDGRFAWFFDDAVNFQHPILCRGSLGLWTVPDELLSEIEAERERS